MKTKSFWFNLVGIVLALELVGCTLMQGRNPTLTPSADQQADTTLPPPTANRNPVLTGIQAPVEGSSFPLNSIISVDVSFDSQKPIQLVQVYLDGLAVDSITPDPQAQVASLQIPGAALQGEGLHTLMVMTFDSDGRAALSNVVHLNGIPAEPIAYSLTIKKGDTLQAFADRLNIDLDDLKAANPDLAILEGITSDTQTLLMDLTLVVPLGTPPALQPFSGKAPGQVQYAPGIPTPPSTNVQLDGCDVQVTVAGQEGQSLGYTLYRLDLDTARFVEIASAPPGGDGGAVFEDKTLYGPTQYMVSAYNDSGETFSIPVVAKPIDPGCNPVQANLPVSDGILTLTTDVKSVYFYISINAGEFDRWPAKQGEFLFPSNGKIDLLSLMKNRPDLNLTYPLYLDLEAWGWKAGELLYLGSAYAELNEADLKICGLPDCSNEGSVNYVYTTSIADAKQASREMKWLTSLPEINTILFQLSIAPFPSGYQQAPPGLVYAQLKSGINGWGYFVIDFANLPQPSQMNIPVDYGEIYQPTETGQPEQITSNGLDWLTSQLEKVDQSQGQFWDLGSNLIHPGSLLPVEKKFYARFIPMNGGQPAGPVSNTVVIDYLPDTDNPSIVIKSIPSIYDVHLEQDQFTPPIPPDPTIGWGCVDVLAVDPYAMAWTDPVGPWQYAYGIWLYHYNTHTPICPTPWDPDANKSPVEKLWDYVSDGIGIVNQAFGYAKDAVIGPFEAGFQLLSLGNCGNYCHQWLHVGLDLALAAYGIPPEIPDLNKLTDQGIAYVVDAGLKELQLDGACDVIPKCREELTNMLKDMKGKFNSQITNTYQNEDTAHAHGVNPLAIPYGGAVTVQPAAASHWRMPTAVVTITRKLGTENVTDDELRYQYDYWLDVWIHANNQTCVGQKHTYSTASCSVNGGVAYGCNDVVETLDTPCEGTLFFGRIQVPILQPGESRQVIVILMPQPYFLPVPLEYQVYQSMSSNDFPYLYVGADTTIQATMIGSIQGGPWPFEMLIAADGPYPLILPADLEYVH